MYANCGIRQIGSQRAGVTDLRLRQELQGGRGQVFFRHQMDEAAGGVFGAGAVGEVLVQPLPGHFHVSLAQAGFQEDHVLGRVARAERLDGGIRPKLADRHPIPLLAE